MPNLLSYIQWRGDIPFQSQPFCEADNLLFSTLAYLDFEGIVPPAPEGAGTITVPKNGSLQTASLPLEPGHPAAKQGEHAAFAGKPAAKPAQSASFSGHPAADATIAKTAAAFAESIHTDGRKKRVAPSPAGQTISLTEAAEAYCENLSTRKTPEISERYNPLAELLRHSRRYAEVRVGSYVSVSSDDKPLQFVAMTFSLPDGTRYIAFRGTGDEIEDWRQDFMISFTQTAAQEMAVQYMRARFREFPSSSFYIGGHSKGGNLALYAGMCAPSAALARIKVIYSNDGPGICPELRREGYDRALEKLVRIVPEFSVIGMLFEPSVAPIIVKSDANSIQQHDPITWQISGKGFETAAALSKESVGYNHIFAGWIESASMAERESFTRDFFDALKSGGAVNIQDITGNGVNGFGTILASLVHSEKATHIAFRKFFESMLSYFRSVKPKDLATNQLGFTGGAVMFLGLIFLILPRASTHIIGYSLLGIGLLLLLRKTLHTAVSPIEDRRKKFFVFLELLLVIGLTYLMSTAALMTLLENVLIGCAFLVLAILLLRRTIRLHRPGKNLEQVVGFLFSAIFLGVGIFSITFPTRIFTARSITVGAVLVVAGVLLLSVGAYREVKKRTNQ